MEAKWREFQESAKEEESREERLKEALEGTCCFGKYLVVPFCLRDIALKLIQNFFRRNVSSILDICGVVSNHSMEDLNI